MYQDYGQSGCFQNVVQRFWPVHQDYGQSGCFQNVAILAEILSGVSRLWTIRMFPKHSAEILAGASRLWTIRMFPKRSAEILAGASRLWTIRMFPKRSAEILAGASRLWTIGNGGRLTMNISNLDFSEHSTDFREDS